MNLEMTGVVETARISGFLLSQEKHFSSAELSYAKSLMKWLPYERKFIGAEEYFVFLRTKQLKAHKQHAQFAIEIFSECGVQYSEVQKET